MGSPINNGTGRRTQGRLEPESTSLVALGEKRSSSRSPCIMSPRCPGLAVRRVDARQETRPRTVSYARGASDELGVEYCSADLIFALKLAVLLFYAP